MKLNKFGFLVVGLLLFDFAASAHAWHVKIHNPYGVESTVQLWLANWNVYSVEVDIPPNSSCTYETGAKCPHALTGSIEGFDNAKKDIRLTCLGPRRERADFEVTCVANCFNSEWTIVQHADGTWHFKKGYNADDYSDNWEPPDWVRPEWINPDSDPPDWLPDGGER